MKDKHPENKKRAKENIIVACSVGAILIALGCYINVQNDVPETYAGTAYNYPEIASGSGNRTTASYHFAGFETEEGPEQPVAGRMSEPEGDRDDGPVISHSQNPTGGYDIVVDYAEGTLTDSQIDELIDEYTEQHSDELITDPSANDTAQEKPAPEGSTPEPESQESGPAPDNTQEPASDQSSEGDPVDTSEVEYHDGTDDDGDRDTETEETRKQDDSDKKRYAMPGGFVDENGNGTVSAASVGSPIYDIVSVTWHVMPIEGEAYLSNSEESMKKKLYISDGGAVSINTETIYEDGGSSLSPSCFIATRGYLKAHGMI